MIIDRENVAVRTILSCTNFDDLDVLEIGCGDGRITIGLHKKCKKLVAIDPCKESITTARKKFPEIDFRQGTGEAIDCGDKKFDVVLFSLSLHHQNSCKALLEAERVLAHDGYVLALEPSIDSHISVICNIFRDESNELMEAMEAIHTSNFDLLSIQQIDTEWIFEDVQELYAWLHDFYPQKHHPSTIKQVDALLGEKTLAKPLIISDTLLLSELSPRL